MRRFSLIAALLLPTLAQAATPLMVIRFNQPQVYYEQQLYHAISKAVAIKPDLMIDILSYAPHTGSGSQNADWQRAAQKHARMLTDSLQQMGVPATRIHVAQQAQPGLRYDEAHIFVR